MTWWTWIDPGDPYGDNGLLTEELVTKPSYSAYTYAATAMGQSAFESIVPTASGVEGYLFETQDQIDLYVFWAEDDLPHLEVVPATEVSITSMYGILLETVTDAEDGNADGHVSFWFAEDPVYVEVMH